MRVVTVGPARLRFQIPVVVVSNSGIGGLVHVVVVGRRVVLFRAITAAVELEIVVVGRTCHGP